jgi:protein TonB
MRWWSLSGYGLSLLVHLGFAAGLTAIPKETRRRATAVTVFEAKPKKEKPKEPEKEKPPEPPKPIAVPKQMLTKSAEPPPPAEAPPPPANPTPAGHEAMAALPDFGISLGGSVGGGLAIPTGGRASASGRAEPARNANKRGRTPSAEPAASAEAPCNEPPTKPAYRERVMPQYTDDARAAGIEGRVRVEVDVNADGDVVGVRVVEGLGHGLDESAMVALRRAKFRPIMRCGKPVASPPSFVIPLRFSLSD